MKKKQLYKILSLLTMLALPLVVKAQTDGNIEMADTMRSEGKIYVVVLIVAIVFTGLIVFAFNSDRKISRLEKEIESLKSKKDL